MHDRRKLFMAEVTVAVSLGILPYPQMETTLGIYGIFNARGQEGGGFRRKLAENM